MPHKTQEEILDYVMGQVTGGWEEGTAQDAYDRLKKVHPEACFFWEDAKVDDYAPFSDYTAKAFIAHIDEQCDSLNRFINGEQL